MGGEAGAVHKHPHDATPGVIQWHEHWKEHGPLWTGPLAAHAHRIPEPPEHDHPAEKLHEVTAWGEIETQP
jgi:hypothetical protein